MYIQNNFRKFVLLYKTYIMKKVDYNSYGFKNKAVDKWSSKNGDDPKEKAKKEARESRLNELNNQIEMLTTKGKGAAAAAELKKLQNKRDMLSR
jgi:hypothetical protein